MQNCMLCGVFGCSLNEMPYIDRESEKIMACDQCMEKMVSWCEKHHRRHETLSFEGECIRGCPSCFAEEMKRRR